MSSPGAQRPGAYPFLGADLRAAGGATFPRRSYAAGLSSAKKPPTTGPICAVAAWPVVAATYSSSS
jgi:hypothetical protein